MVKFKTFFLVAAFVYPNVSFADNWKSDIIQTHNKWRNAVKVPSLTWSDELAKSAQGYADKLKNTQHCQMVHSHTNGIGENLFWASPVRYSNGTSAVQAVTGTQVVDDWGKEKQDYNYQINTCKKGKMCGHYTQVVWAGTKQVGCGRAVCDDKSQVWVCQYSPAGNYVGQKPY